MAKRDCYIIQKEMKIQSDICQSSSSKLTSVMSTSSISKSSSQSSKSSSFDFIFTKSSSDDDKDTLLISEDFFSFAGTDFEHSVDSILSTGFWWLLVSFSMDCFSHFSSISYFSGVLASTNFSASTVSTVSFCTVSDAFESTGLDSSIVSDDSSWEALKVF